VIRVGLTPTQPTCELLLPRCGPEKARPELLQLLRDTADFSERRVGLPEVGSNPTLEPISGWPGQVERRAE